MLLYIRVYNYVLSVVSLIVSSLNIFNYLNTFSKFYSRSKLITNSAFSIGAKCIKDFMTSFNLKTFAVGDPKVFHISTPMILPLANQVFIICGDSNFTIT